MKSFLAAVLLSASLVANGHSLSHKLHQDSTAALEIRRIEEVRREALLRGDTATLNAILADDYLVINQFGGVMDKSRMLSDMKSGVLKFDSINEDEVLVRMYGDTAVITGRATSKHEGREITQVRFTRVYLKRNGKWQAVVYQVTRIATT